jgi:ABC-type amino acid transport substrate-binding protein
MDKTLAEYLKTEYKLAISMTCDTGELFSVFMPENSDLKAKINRFIKKSLKSKNYIILLKECFLNKEI